MRAIPQPVFRHSTESVLGQQEAADLFGSILTDCPTKNGTGWQNKVWVTAPGADFYSTNHQQGYDTKSGTSFAAPIVSALAAMCVSIQNDLTKVYPGRADITNNHLAFKQILKDTATPKSDTDINGEIFTDDSANRPQGKRYGWGIVNFDKAVELAASPKQGNGFDTMSLVLMIGKTWKQEN